MSAKPWIFLSLISLLLHLSFLGGESQIILDINSLDAGRDELIRIHGSVGSGIRGVPVAGPGDLDGDGYQGP
tara:strand:+ start:483 stop:698 length:216 start_codon:yes stop_codon:yes gene_type:complete